MPADLTATDALTIALRAAELWIEMFDCRQISWQYHAAVALGIEDGHYLNGHLVRAPTWLRRETALITRRGLTAPEYVAREDGRGFTPLQRAAVWFLAQRVESDTDNDFYWQRAAAAA